MHVLITGATGTVGSNATKYFLECGHAVRAQVRPDSTKLFKLQGRKAEICETDLRDHQGLAGLVKDMDAVVHLGGALPKGAPSNADYIDLNVGSTLALLEGARRYNPGLKSFVHAGSTSVFEFVGWRNGLVTDANRFTNPAGVYRVSKRAGEMLVLSHHQQYGIPASVLVVPEITCGREILGERRKHLTPFTEDRMEMLSQAPSTSERDKALRELEQCLREGRNLVLPLGPNGRPWRQHLGDIRDIVRALEMAIRSPKSAGKSMVIKSNALDYGEGIPHLSKVSGMEYAEVQIVPGADNYWFDISRARDLLGFEPEIDSRRILEDGWRHAQGEDIGIIDGTDYRPIDRPR